MGERMQRFFVAVGISFAIDLVFLVLVTLFFPEYAQNFGVGLFVGSLMVILFMQCAQ